MESQQYENVSVKSEPPDHVLEDFLMDTKVDDINYLNGVEISTVKQEYVTIEIDNSNGNVVLNDTKIKTENTEDNFLYENHDIQQDLVIGQTVMVNIPIQIDSNLPTCSEQFICQICNDKYTTEQFLKAHMYTHLTKKEKHKRKKNKKSEFTCYICKEILPNNGSWKRHKKLHIDEDEGRPIVCRTCNMSFKSLSEADAHNKARHTRIIKTSHKCMVCGEVFDKYKEWYNHKFKHKDGKFICDLCKRGFKTITLLRSHIECHMRQKPYKCDTCNERFSCPSELTQHKRLSHEDTLDYPIHKKSEKYTTQCSKQPTGLICEKNLPTHSNKKLTETLSKKNPPRTQSIQQITEETMDHLIPIREEPHHLMPRIRHDKNYMEEFICDVCDKSFALKRCLDRHKVTHTEYRPFACNLCNKTFTQKPHLDSHQLVHTGEKPFQCEFCLKCFTRSTYLNAHKRSHTGKNLFKCEYCNKTFTRKSSYTQHLKIHIGQEEMKLTFKCNECDKFFVTRSSFRHHRDLNHRPARYICNFCDKPFRYKSDHDRHNMTHKSEFVCANCHVNFPTAKRMIEHQCVLELLEVSFEEDKEMVLGI